MAGQAEHGQAGLDLAALLRDLGDRDELNGPSLCGRTHGSRWTSPAAAVHATQVEGLHEHQNDSAE